MRLIFVLGMMLGLQDVLGSVFFPLFPTVLLVFILISFLTRYRSCLPAIRKPARILWQKRQLVLPSEATKKKQRPKKNN